MWVRRNEIAQVCTCGPFLINGKLRERPVFRHQVACPIYHQVWDRTMPPPTIGDLVKVHGDFAIVMGACGSSFDVMIDA